MVKGHTENGAEPDILVSMNDLAKLKASFAHCNTVNQLYFVLDVQFQVQIKL